MRFKNKGVLILLVMAPQLFFFPTMANPDASQTIELAFQCRKHMDLADKAETFKDCVDEFLAPTIPSEIKSIFYFWILQTKQELIYRPCTDVEALIRKKKEELVLCFGTGALLFKKSESQWKMLKLKRSSI